MTTATARTARLTAGLALLLALGGCGQDDEQPGDGDAPSPTRTEPMMTPGPTTPSGTPSTPGHAATPGSPTAPGTPTPPGTPNAAKAAAAQAVQDLAERLGVAADDVEVVHAAAVTWRDGSLGCPEPGMAYTQALTDGLLIELSAQGRTYSYHSGPGREPFLCERPQAPLRSDT